MSKRLFLENIKNGVLQINFKENKSLFSIDTFVIKDLIAKIRMGFGYGLSEPEINQLFGKGVECNLLQPGAYWKKGKIKICVEFIPDETESESPLDDIRQHIDSNI